MSVADFINHTTLNNIQNYMNDSNYRESIENAASFNTRISIERKQRLPFLDSQTGVAQNHSNLFMTSSQRMPGMPPGSIYTYPSKRWRKKRRQYLLSFYQPRRKEVEGDIDMHTISTVENPAAINEDSKDSANMKDDSLKETWYYDDLDIPDAGEFDDQDPDSDYDYEESYSKRKKKRGGKVTRGGGRGGKRKTAAFDPATDAEKPFSCELCGARYKTRPGLSYHYSHSHKDRDDEEDDSTASPKPQRGDSLSTGGRRGRNMVPVQQQPPPPPPPQMAMQHPHQHQHQHPLHHVTQHQQLPPQPVVMMEDALQHAPQIASASAAANLAMMEKRRAMMDEKERAAPSPYCDFCLGDATENKKTFQAEELVSCSDCGRSGHPSCLQFTPNMMISVKKYRWQCIECKCCSMCGNSDNDDQLLFCDDCDRGYHMYCLTPPLSSPPEGSWSCSLCIMEFHTRK